jgi:hypothetical protein
MLTNHIPGTVTRLSEFVLSWAVNHLESLTASSQHKKHDPSWPLAFGALYVPSEHVVSYAGTAKAWPRAAGYNAVADA